MKNSDKKQHTDYPDESDQSLAKLIKYILIGLLLSLSFLIYVAASIYFGWVPSQNVPFHIKMLIIPLVILCICTIIYVMWGKKSRVIRKYLPWVVVAILAYYIGMFTK